MTALLQTASKERPFVLIGDTNHADPGLKSFLQGMDMLAAAREAGIRHIFLEIPTSYQDVMDKVASGEMSEKTFVDEYGFASMWLSGQERRAATRNFAAFLRRANADGIKIHAADDMSGMSSGFALVAGMWLSGLAKTYDDECGRPLSEAPDRFYNYYFFSRTWMSAAAALSLRTILTGRKDDRLAMRLVRERSNMEPSIIIFGAGHMTDHENGFYQGFRDKTAAVVNVFGDRKTLSEGLSTKNSPPSALSLVLDGRDQLSLATALSPPHKPAPAPSKKIG